MFTSVEGNTPTSLSYKLKITSNTCTNEKFTNDLIFKVFNAGKESEIKSIQLKKNIKVSTEENIYIHFGERERERETE